MAENEHPRVESARLHDDKDIIENAEDAPSFASTAGGKIAQNVASQDELNQAIAGENSRTRVMNADKGGEPNIPTRADFKGQSGGGA